MPLTTFSQTEGKITYIIDANHLKDCRGGAGRCIGSKFEASLEKTTASVAKTYKNKLLMSLDKVGFSAREWKELLETKTFPIDNESTLVDGELLRILEIDPKFNKIKRAVYPVLVIDNKAIIVLELAESY